ncbi:MAG: SoxR reducing system RseC family protein [Candidatus Omnitrophota bacterium]
MIQETVEVVDIRDGRATVTFSRKSLCDSCKVSSLCGAGSHEVTIDAGSVSLAKGDTIEVGIEERKTVLASVLVFFIPVVIFIAALVLFQKKGELTSFLVSLLILAVYYIMVMFLVRRMPQKFDVRIIRKL